MNKEYITVSGKYPLPQEWRDELRPVSQETIEYLNSHPNAKIAKIEVLNNG